MRRYKRKDDDAVLEKIKAITDKRPTYGYKRVTAMVNKHFNMGYNKKRIHRVMGMNGLLLKRNERKRDHHKTGKIITLHSNTRWCSDALEIHCFNGEKVFVAFVLDCHDREAISYVASRSPLLAINIQSLMIQAVEKRFHKLKTDRTIQWLSDRGSIYRAHETVRIGRHLGLQCCFTAPYSPESNGMSESFVNTLKRDYVYTSDCFDANTVLDLLPSWFEDYNNEAPHSGLKMMSPIDYRKLTNPGV